MVANYFKGLGYPAFTTISPVSPFFNNQLKGFEPDVDYAMELLKKSGFKKDRSGRLVDKEGHSVEFDLVTMAGGTFLPTIGNMAIEDMKKLGMKVNFQELNFNILMDKVHTSCDWDAGIYALSGGDPFEPNDGANVYRSNGRLHLFDQRQPDKDGEIVVEDAREWEKRIDSIFSEGATTLDKNKRKELYDEFQKILYEQAPFVYLCDAMNIIGARNTVKNYQPTQLSQLVLGLHNIEEIWIENSKAKSKGKPDENK
jgi:peptide/nickel transport system substrate-binding protein